MYNQVNHPSIHFPTCLLLDLPHIRKDGRKKKKAEAKPVKPFEKGSKHIKLKRQNKILSARIWIGKPIKNKVVCDM